MKDETSYTPLRILAYSLIWWLFWALIQTLVLHRLNLDWEIAALDSLVFSGLLTLAGFWAILIYRYYQPGASNRFLRFVYGAVITLVCCEGFSWIMMALYNENSSYLEFLKASMPVRFIFAMMVIAFVTLVNWLLSTLKDQKLSEKRKSESEKLLKEAELVKLRQQLQPHFLFNSLNSISSLAGSDPGKARMMIQQLSDFLRGTLRKDEEQLVSLKEELHQLQLYLDIEKVRFADRLKVEISAPSDSRNLKIPPLLLQPMVENAIKHGLYGTTGEITVAVKATKKEGELCIEISNPFDPETSGSAGGTGFGLSSLQRRLFLIFSRNDLLQIEKQDHTFNTKLKIPQLK